MFMTNKQGCQLFQKDHFVESTQTDSLGFFILHVFKGTCSTRKYNVKASKKGYSEQSAKFSSSGVIYISK
jgi:hypothetical protein